MNVLYYGDNLQILRNNILDESVDLAYLDPLFNSKANYKLLIRTPKDHESVSRKRLDGNYQPREKSQCLGARCAI